MKSSGLHHIFLLLLMNSEHCIAFDMKKVIAGVDIGKVIAGDDIEKVIAGGDVRKEIAVGDIKKVIAIGDTNKMEADSYEKKVITGQIAKCCPLDQVWDEPAGECQEGLFDMNLVTVWTNGNTSYSLAQTDENIVALKHDQLTSEDCSEHEIHLLDLDEEYQLLSNGDLLLPHRNMLYHPTNPQHYCIEMFRYDKEDPRLRVVVCDFDKIKDESHVDMRQVRLVLFPFLLSLSCIALCLTIIVYSLVPEFNNLPGKILLRISLTLLGGMSLLLLMQIIGSIENLPEPLCVLGAFLLQFFFLSAFSWMTVMSFDIFKTFRSLNKNGRHLYRTESKNSYTKIYKNRFLAYCLFAWGTSMLATGFTFLLDSDLISDTLFLKPGFGETSCWFNGDLEILVFFYGPIGILLLGNLAMFFCTIRSISTFQNSMKSKLMLQKSNITQTVVIYHWGRERMELYCKVFLIMGGSWSFEIIVRQAGAELC